MAKIYVASSWRNKLQIDIVNFLRNHRHDVYDFRNPKIDNHGFHWADIDPKWKQWNTKIYRNYLNHPLAVTGFKLDFEAMQWADIFVGVQPFGISTSIEMGWAAGNGKKTILLLENGEPELMVKIFDNICCDLDEVITAINSQDVKN